MRDATRFAWKVSIVLLLFSTLGAFGQSIRDEATELLLRAQRTALQFPTDASRPYHERVKFILSGPASADIKGQFIKDYLSSDQWREREELGEYQRITVRNGGQVGEFRSAAFEPLWLGPLRRLLPPVTFGLEHDDKVRRIAEHTIAGVPNQCIEYETRQAGGRQDNEVCVSKTDGTLTSWEQRVIEGACVLGCRTETKWSEYTPLGDKLYPRHVRITKHRSIDAEVEFTSGSDLHPDTFRIPANLQIRRACDKTSSPRRVQGELPSYPHRLNEWLFEGSIAVQARIGVDGRVQEAQIASPHGKPLGLPGVNPGLEGRDVDNAVLEAVRKWVFEPARCDGVPMVDNTLITFRAEVR